MAPEGSHQDQSRVLCYDVNKQWEYWQFNEDVDGILKNTDKGKEDQKLQIITNIIINIVAEWLDTKDKQGSKNIGVTNRQQAGISQLRLKSLRWQVKGAKKGFEEQSQEVVGPEALDDNIIINIAIEWLETKDKHGSKNIGAPKHQELR